MSNIFRTRILFWFAFAAFVASIILMGYHHLFGRGLFRPILVLEERIHHMGEVPPNTLVETEVTVTNTGICPLKIKGMRSGCSGCVKILSYPKEPIYRNETVIVRFALNTESLKGKVRKSMIIMSNDPVRPIFPVLIDAVVSEKE